MLPFVVRLVAVPPRAAARAAPRSDLPGPRYHTAAVIGAV